MWVVWIFASAAFAADVGDHAPPLGTTTPEVALEGRVRLVNFWATWCAPCRAELPLLQALHAQLDPAKAVVVGVNIDTSKGAAEGYVRRFKLSLPVVYDPKQALAGQFEPPAMPTSYLLDANGTIIKVYEGELHKKDLPRIQADIEGATK